MAKDYIKINTPLELAYHRGNLGQPKSIEVKIGVIFSEIRNRIESGYNLRDILKQVDSLKFQTSEEKHEMTYWYESRLNRMGNAGRNGGEYYTPRPLIRTIVKVVDPQIGKTVYDECFLPTSALKFHIQSHMDV